jgi:3-hydroxyacyl-[acyl-carrier-protein] dehydratase
MWIDKFVNFQKGVRATAVKNISLAEDHLHDHFPGYPTMPASLLIEGMAQTGGVLIGDAFEFEEKVILAKVAKAVFHREVGPGDQVLLTAEVVDQIRPEGATINGTIVTREGDPVAEITLLFVHLDNSRTTEEYGEGNFVFHEDFLRLLKTTRLDSA